MDSPSPSSPNAFNNPIYSEEGDDSFFEAGDHYMVSISTDKHLNTAVLCLHLQTDPIYDGMDDEL